MTQTGMRANRWRVNPLSRFFKEFAKPLADLDLGHIIKDSGGRERGTVGTQGFASSGTEAVFPR